MAETVLDNNNNENQYFVGVRFNESGKSYFFSTNEKLLKIADKVVVETARGLEIGIVSILPQDISTYNFKLELKPVLRIATEEDIAKFEENIKLAKESFITCYKEVNNLGLDMNLTSCEYTLDRTKVIFSYLASERVDFRELLKVLAAKLKCRIELRQIGTRDKAKIIGGIGICGLQLCCTTFLNEFDGISINRAKNQMLSLNIPKLSGHCGKLICCLKYEDDTYTNLKKDFPNIGHKFNYNGAQYRVSSMNVITRIVKIETPDDVQFIPLDELKKYL
ncbi:MAG: stage 0 sporulation family protein [Bacilli bacterium]